MKKPNPLMATRSMEFVAHLTRRRGGDERFSWPYGGDGSVTIMTVRAMVLAVMLNHLVPSFTSPLIRNDRAFRAF